MQRRLTEAAQKGDVHELSNLIRDDPLFFRVAENPLHIACIGGHVEFVKEVLHISPKFVTDLNKDGLSPLHIASGNGDVEIVKELLKIGSHLCLVKGKEKRIPLHCAVVKGKKEVIKELLLTCSDSITQVTARGESCFHLAVKNNQFEAFEILVEHSIFQKREILLNSKDQQGNSIMHLATYGKQYEVIELLLDEKNSFAGTLDVNSLNKKGHTPLDALLLEGEDEELENMLRLAGAVKSDEINQFPSPIVVFSTGNLLNQTRRQEEEQRTEQSKRASKKLKDYFKYDKIKDSPIQVRNTLLVIVVLIATTTYQPVLSPPGGVWQDDLLPSTNNTTTSSSSDRSPPPHTSGQAVMGTNEPVLFGFFLVCNSVGFFMSLHMLNFLTTGLPMKFELRVILLALSMTYITCMIAITPSRVISLMFLGISVVMPMLMPVLTIVVRDIPWPRWCRRSTHVRALV